MAAAHFAAKKRIIHQPHLGAAPRGHRMSPPLDSLLQDARIHRIELTMIITENKYPFNDFITNP